MRRCPSASSARTRGQTTTSRCETTAVTAAPRRPRRTSASEIAASDSTPWMLAVSARAAWVSPADDHEVAAAQARLLEQRRACARSRSRARSATRRAQARARARRSAGCAAPCTRAISHGRRSRGLVLAAHPPARRGAPRRDAPGASRSARRCRARRSARGPCSVRRAAADVGPSRPVERDVAQRQPAGAARGARASRRRWGRWRWPRRRAVGRRASAAARRSCSVVELVGVRRRVAAATAAGAAAGEGSACAASARRRRGRRATTAQASGGDEPAARSHGDERRARQRRRVAAGQPAQHRGADVGERAVVAAAAVRRRSARAAARARACGRCPGVVGSHAVVGGEDQQVALRVQALEPARHRARRSPAAPRGSPRRRRGGRRPGRSRRGWRTRSRSSSPSISSSVDGDRRRVRGALVLLVDPDAVEHLRRPCRPCAPGRRRRCSSSR